MGELRDGSGPCLRVRRELQDGVGGIGDDVRGALSGFGHSTPSKSRLPYKLLAEWTGVAAHETRYAVRPVLGCRRRGLARLGNVLCEFRELLGKRRAPGG